MPTSMAISSDEIASDTHRLDKPGTRIIESEYGSTGVEEPSKYTGDAIFERLKATVCVAKVDLAIISCV